MPIDVIEATTATVTMTPTVIEAAAEAARDVAERTHGALTENEGKASKLTHTC